MNNLREAIEKRGEYAKIENVKARGGTQTHQGCSFLRVGSCTGLNKEIV